MGQTLAILPNAQVERANIQYIEYYLQFHETGTF